MGLPASIFLCLKESWREKEFVLDFRYIHALLFICQCFTKRTIKNGVNSNIYFVKNCRNLSQIMESISHSGITNIEDG